MHIVWRTEMKVLALNGSPRKNGNTAKALSVVCEELERFGIQTEIVQLGGSNVFGCLHCDACIRNKNLRCVRNDDIYSKNF